MKGGDVKKVRKVFFLIAVGIVATLAGKMMYTKYSDYNLAERDLNRYIDTTIQKLFNEFEYTAIDGDAEKLREIISETHIELHGEIENVKLHKLRDRMFDLIWTHHIGGFSNYMKLRKPEGIEYNFYTNSRSYHNFINGIGITSVIENERVSLRFTTNSPPQMTNEIDYIKRSANRENNFTNLISEVCLDYDVMNIVLPKAVELIRPWATNALFGVHVFRTNSLDYRFCSNVLDFTRESSRWPFTSTNRFPRFSLITNTIVPRHVIPFPIYTTPETPRQELESTGEITLAYAYFLFKCIHHENRAAPFIAQWHWDKNPNRWITDYFVSGSDYRYPNTRYYTEPRINTIF